MIQNVLVRGILSKTFFTINLIELFNGTAKFWLEPIVALEVYYNMKSKELSEIEKIVKERKDEFIRDWKSQKPFH